jgi:hypothetical protein
MTSLAEISSWFKTSTKPSQIQFWLAWDSFWHKEAAIPQANIQNLENDLAHKASLNGGNTFTGKQIIEGNLALKGTVTSDFEWFSDFGDPDNANMYFEKENLFSEYPEFNRLFFFTIAPDSFDINIQSELIPVRLSVDGVSKNYVFTKNEHFNKVTGYGPMWTMPALTNYTDIYLDGAIIHKSTPSSVRLNLPADTDQKGKFIYDNVVQVQPNGTLKAVAPVVPTIDAVLKASDNTIQNTIEFRTNDNRNRNAINGEGVVMGYTANNRSDNDRYASYKPDGIRFESHFNNPVAKYAVSVAPNVTQGNVDRVDVVLPKKSGHLPVKSELPGLGHRTIATTASRLTDSQLRTLITPLDTSGGDNRALHTTLVYNGSVNAIWSIPVENAASYRYTIINNTGNTITINRAGATTLWIAGLSNTSVTIPENGWAEIIGSDKENRFYFRIY